MPYCSARSSSCFHFEAPVLCVYSSFFLYVPQTVVVETEVSLCRLLALFDTLCGLVIFLYLENVAYTMSAITEIDKWVEWEDFL